MSKGGEISRLKATMFAHVLLALCVQFAGADLPVQCAHHKIVGSWEFKMVSPTACATTSSHLIIANNVAVTGRPAQDVEV